MSAQAKPYITPEEYLAAERAADFKSLYYEGEVFAMSGASRAHNLLVSNLIISLGNRIGDKCSVFPSDMRVHVAANGLYTYPDVSVVCGKEEYLEEAYLDTLLNPVVLAEVLSESTGKNDRGSKFMLYKSIASLQHYVLVDSQRVSIAVYSRAAAGSWLFQEYQGLEAVVPLPALSLELPLAEVYRRLELPV
ncbi:Endonuclease, Uma2 family (restriction endonuclease fold) [Hymenobacter daecheongensis DSM 21074]|uniref:Endonuclease, Uma2 family (Restriction endonuclease fold) n=1 Tax=Hymenobacter daecheongensis DSM 21074 TaxID=1121955 RepID=A0A1M6JJT4_9BACT|nr:Uma2 family endonuclease [Hymenobacter daecheongensis]SHJ46977.1 Endonuclease, Uma2 family (restriction endonuclease fold) [Hymenobacter daecheongensis DSM 21074]